MTLADILARSNALALWRFVALVALFLALHAIRTPVRWIERALSAAMRGLDRHVAARVTSLGRSPA